MNPGLRTREAWLRVSLVFVTALFCPSALACDAGIYGSDWKAFADEVERAYPFFDLKGNRADWETARVRLTDAVNACASDSAFLGIVIEAIRVLRDAHMGLSDAKAEIPTLPKRHYPAVSFLPATENRVVVLWADTRYTDKLRPGTVVATIDGQDARRYLDERGTAAWPESFCSSPQRARMLEYRIPLRGPEGDTHTLMYLSDEGERELTLTCNVEAGGWPHMYNSPDKLKRVGRSFLYGTLPGGAGYMYVRRMDDSVEPGIQRALEACPDAHGWIVDLRGNGGGGYGDSLIALLKTLPRPVAAIIDAGCMSAGETFARDLQREAGARLFGEKSAGASSSKRSWTFPSGIATVTFSTRSRWRNDGQPIEFNGIDPDVLVEAVPEEVQEGVNSAIRRAQEYLGAIPASNAVTGKGVVRGWLMGR